MPQSVAAPNPQPEFVLTNFTAGMNSRIAPTSLDSEQSALILNMDYDEQRNALHPRYGLKKRLGVKTINGTTWDNLYTWSDIPTNPLDPASAYGITTENLVGSVNGFLYAINMETGNINLWGGEASTIGSRNYFITFFDWVLTFNPTYPTFSFYAFDRLNPGLLFQEKQAACHYNRATDTWALASETTLLGIKFGAVAGTRLWLFSDLYPNVIFCNSSNFAGNNVITNINKALTSHNTAESLEFVEVGYADGDIIKGVHGLDTDVLVFKRNHIYAVSPQGTGNADLESLDAYDLFNVRCISNTHGCLSGYAICEWQGNVIFPTTDGIYAMSRSGLSSFENWPVNAHATENRGGGRVTASLIGGYSVRLLSDAIRDFYRTSLTGVIESDKISAVVFKDKYIISFPEINSGDGSVNTKCYALDLQTGAWSQYDGAYVATAYATSRSVPYSGLVTQSNSADSLEQLIVCDTIGNLYTRDYTATADGNNDVAYTKMVRTKAFNMDDYFSMKLFDVLKVHLNLRGVDMSLHFKLIFDEDDTQTFEFDVSTDTTVSTHITGYNTTWDDFNWNDAKWGTSRNYEVNTTTELASGSMYWDIIEKIDNITAGKRGRSLQVEISCNGTTDDFTLHQLALEVQNLGRSNMPRFYSFTES